MSGRTPLDLIHEDEELYYFLQEILRDALGRNRISSQDILWKEDRHLTKSAIEERGHFQGFWDGVQAVATELAIDIYDEPDGTEY